MATVRKGVLLIWISVLLATFTYAAGPVKARIVVLADKVTHKISPLTTGACLEDVNHEVYGGIYSQMIFGESFEEPSGPVPMKDFMYEGQLGGPIRGSVECGWRIKDGILLAPAGEGPKLLAKDISIVKGRVGVDICFGDRDSGVAGLIVKVGDSAPGADNFDGYEIAIDPNSNQLLLGKHLHNWDRLQDVSYPVELDKWLSLEVELDENRIQIFVNGTKYIDFKDTNSPLKEGWVGFRTWQRTARFRNFRIQTVDGIKRIPFEYAQNDAENNQVSRVWTGYREGNAKGIFAIETENTFNGRQSQKISFRSGTGRIGISNSGLNQRGMYFQKDKDYEGLLWIRAEKPVLLTLSLEDQSGKTVYATHRISVKDTQWQRVDFSMTSSGENENGRFCLSLTEPGSVVVGYAFLQPGQWGRFKGLPVRLDVAEGLIRQQLTVLRYGGCMANAPEYRWKKMIGPRDLRPPYKGWWYPYSSNGWGIIDFMNFCEAAGFECIPDFNIEETPEDMADFIEYIQGGAETKWGRQRIADGHLEPYRIKYIQIGNEEVVDGHYLERFKLLAGAIWSRDPGLIPVVGDFSYHGPITDPFHIDCAPRIDTLAVHQEILRFTRKNNGTVWFDVHIWNHEPRDPDLEGKGMGMRNFVTALEKISEGAKFKVCVFEENANNPQLRRGLSHAHLINEIQRYDYEMPVLCAANCLQPDGQNDNGWDQGLLFLDQSKVWGQSSYYVTQMVSRSYQPLCVESYVDSHNNALDITACRSLDGKVLSLRVVNLDALDMETEIDVMHFVAGRSDAEVIQIRGNLADTNMHDNMAHIVPVESRVLVPNKNERLKYTFPAYSFTIINFQ